MAAAMEQPTPVFIAIGAIALAAIGGAFYVSYVAATEPSPPPGAIEASAPAQQPAKDETGQPLPVQPGEPEENQPVVNAPPAGSTAQAPTQPGTP